MHRIPRVTAVQILKENSDLYLRPRVHYTYNHHEIFTYGGDALERAVLSSTLVRKLRTLFELCPAAHAFLFSFIHSILFLINSLQSPCLTAVRNQGGKLKVLHLFVIANT